MTRYRRKIPIAEPVCDLGGLIERGAAGRGVTLHDLLDRSGNQEVSAADRIQLRFVEDALSSGEPARGRSSGAAMQQPKRKPPGRSRRAFGFATVEEHLVRTRPERLALVIPSCEVGRDCESFEILGLQRCVAVGGLEQPTRVGPGSLLE